MIEYMVLNRKLLFLPQSHLEEYFKKYFKVYF